MNPILLNDTGYLQGQVLIALCNDAEDFFHRTVVYVVRHDAKGAMGLVLNKPHSVIDFTTLIDRLDLELDSATSPLDSIVVPLSVPEIYTGGPVEEGHGFVLHTPDYNGDDSEHLAPNLCLNSNVNILKDIATNTAPKHHKICLGCCGWSQGQLETEIQRHQWLACPPQTSILFNNDPDQQWHTALASIRMTADMVVSQKPFGRA